MQAAAPGALAGPLVAWVLSLTGVAAAWAGLELPGTALVPLALLSWIALSGLPRERAGAGRPAWRASVWVLFALPPCALCAALDARAGASGAELLRTLAGGLALVWLGALAAETAAERPRDRVYPALWLVWVPGAAALLSALRFAPLPGDEPAGLALDWIAHAHPLAWAWRGAAQASVWSVSAAALGWLVARERARGARGAR